MLNDWLAKHTGEAQDPLFPTPHRGAPQPQRHRTPPRRHLTIFHASCPSLRAKRVTVHTLRHTAAMRLFTPASTSPSSLWLRHEQIATHLYLHADMNQKQRAIARVTPPGTSPGRRRPPDPLPAFLDNR